ncbi:MAG: PilZ domain-containing protein [Phycisphaerae bacterium]|jgi:hypothetical protein|nr:PilZ domain-containing protein [Phycisphaerae bacterium]
MDAEEIVKLTPDAIRGLIDMHRVDAVPKQAPGLRREERWPFPGTVEVWLPEGSYGDRHILATLHNLSTHGLAMRARRPIAKDTVISLAIHQPAQSCYGTGIVRHCTRAHVGYLIGVEFTFDPEDETDTDKR